MWTKSLFLMTSTLLIVGQCGLLRTPKVYNALITTDENLTPSRAFPVVQPVLQETGFAFPLNPYSNFAYDIYDPYNQFAIQQSRNFGYRPNVQEQQFQQSQPRSRIQLDEEKIEKPSQPIIAQEKGENSENKISDDAQKQKQAQGSMISKPAKQNSPIPLNDFGLPPSLVPIQRFGPQNPQLNYNPYPYNFPVIFDSFGSYNNAPYPVLPPFPFYPQQRFEGNPQNQQSNDGLFNPIGIPEIVSNRNGREQEQGQTKPIAPENIPQQAQSSQPTQPESINIKNYDSKNPDIPDVPAPPLPTSKGATTQSIPKE